MIDSHAVPVGPDEFVAALELGWELAVPPTRIVMLNDFVVARGGATVLALLAAQVVREAGIPVTFISGDDAENDDLTAMGVEHVSVGRKAVPSSNLLGAGAAAMWSQSSAMLIAQWIEDNDTPDTIYHLHGWHKHLTPSVFTALRPVLRRTVVHAHDFFLSCPNGAFMDYQRSEICYRRPLSVSCAVTNCDRRQYAHKLYRIARQSLQNRIIGDRYDFHVLMIHDGMRPFFERSGVPHDQLTTLLNPCQPFAARPVMAGRNLPFVFVGRLDAEKGPYDFAAACAKANVEGWVIGEGPERAAIARDFPNVKLLGWRSRSEIAELMLGARCLVMPSRYPEPFGLVAVEALACGLPVIASCLSFVAPSIAAGGMGLSLDTSDIKQLARVLRELADDDRRIGSMSARALHGVAALASDAQAWRDGLLDSYQNLLARAS